MGLWCKPISLGSGNISSVGNAGVSGFVNSFNDEPGLVYRSSGLSSLYFVLDLGAATALDTFALIGSNLTSAATWRIRGATSVANLTAAPGYDSTAITAWASTSKTATRAKSFLHAVAVQTYRYWRVDLTDAANPAGYVEFQRLVIGKAVVPALTFDWGAEYFLTDRSNKEVLPTGHEVVDEMDILPGWRVTYSWESRTEFETATRPLHNVLGKSRSVLFVPDPSSGTGWMQDDIVFGRIDDDATQTLADYDIYRREVAIVAIAP